MKRRGAVSGGRLKKMDRKAAISSVRVGGGGEEGEEEEGGWKGVEMKGEKKRTHSSLRSSSICFLENDTGCAPGKLCELRPSSSATSARSARSSSPWAFMPGLAMSWRGCAPWSMADRVRSSKSSTGPKSEIRARPSRGSSGVVTCRGRHELEIDGWEKQPRARKRGLARVVC